MFVECLISTILRYWSLSAYWLEPDGTRAQWYLPLEYDYGDDYDPDSKVSVSLLAMPPINVASA